MSRNYTSRLSQKEVKVENLDTVAKYLYDKKDVKKCCALMFTGQIGIEATIWKNKGQSDRNLILVDSCWTNIKMTKAENGIKDCLEFPYNFTKQNVKEHLVDKNYGPVNIIHFDTMSTLDGYKNQYTMGQILDTLTVPGFVKRGSRLAFTFVRAHDGKTKKIADKKYNGNRVAVLHEMLMAKLNRKIEYAIAHADYTNGVRDTYPLTWCVFEI